MHLPVTVLLFLIHLVFFSKGLVLPLECTDGIMSTPTYGMMGAIFTVCSNNTINGAPSLIYEVLIDFPQYSQWNTFVYAVDLPPNVTSASDVYIGMPMTFHTSGLIPAINTTSNELMTYLEPQGDDGNPPFVGWRYNPGTIAVQVVQAEHISVLYDIGGGMTRYVSWETYYGAVALVVGILKGNLQAEFDKQGADLKRWVEDGEEE